MAERAHFDQPIKVVHPDPLCRCGVNREQGTEFLCDFVNREIFWIAKRLPQSDCRQNRADKAEFFNGALQFLYRVGNRLERDNATPFKRFSGLVKVS